MEKTLSQPKQSLPLDYEIATGGNNYQTKGLTLTHSPLAMTRAGF
jgi:hypothetical protein